MTEILDRGFRWQSTGFRILWTADERGWVAVTRKNPVVARLVTEGYLRADPDRWTKIAYTTVKGVTLLHQVEDGLARAIAVQEKQNGVCSTKRMESHGME